MKHLTILILFAVFFVAIVAQSDDGLTQKEKREFQQWAKKYNKTYDSKDDEENAMLNWVDHKRNIDEHNKLFKQGKKKHKMMLNEHSDLSLEELEDRLGGLILAPVDDMRSARVVTSMPSYKSAPKSIDWRKRGLVAKVENQDPCGSCWTFSVAGVVNAMIRKKNKNSKTLVSPQQLLDCLRDQVHLGCNGGDPTTAMNWIQENGITSEQQYPYKGEQQECQTNNTKVSEAKISEVFQIVLDGNETALQYLSGNVGPLSITICLEPDFYHYSGGVYQHDNCCTDPAHAPILVGYGRDRVGGDYWLVKNSWGPTWGENGYIKMARNYPETNGNMCGIAFYATWCE